MGRAIRLRRQKLPMGLGTPPLESENLLEPTPLRSRFLARGPTAQQKSNTVYVR